MRQHVATHHIDCLRRDVSRENCCRLDIGNGTGVRHRIRHRIRHGDQGGLGRNRRVSVSNSGCLSLQLRESIVNNFR